MLLSWDFHNDEERIAKNSLTMLEQIFRSKAKGSIYALLAKLNYVTQIDVDANDILKSAFKMFTVEFELTETGMLAYRELIALMFEYFRKVKDEWLEGDKPLDLFEEHKIISQLSYDIFTV